MARFIHLSHVIDPKDNAWPGEPTVQVEPDRRIGVDGKPFNSAMIHLPNHFGTHMDAPHHFNPDGIDMIDLPDDIWGYETETDTHTVDVHIGRLRERFRDNPDFKIVTMRGVGYKVVKL